MRCSRWPILWVPHILFPQPLSAWIYDYSSQGCTTRHCLGLPSPRVIGPPWVPTASSANNRDQYWCITIYLVAGCPYKSPFVMICPKWTWISLHCSQCSPQHPIYGFINALFTTMGSYTSLLLTKELTLQPKEVRQWAQAFVIYFSMYSIIQKLQTSRKHGNAIRGSVIMPTGWQHLGGLGSWPCQLWCVLWTSEHFWCLLHLTRSGNKSS